MCLQTSDARRPDGRRLSDENGFSHVAAVGPCAGCVGRWFRQTLMYFLLGGEPRTVVSAGQNLLGAGVEFRLLNPLLCVDVEIMLRARCTTQIYTTRVTKGSLVRGG